MSESSNRLLRKRGLRVYAWLVFISVVSGWLATFWRLVLSDDHELSDFEPASALRRILICSGVSFAVLLLLLSVSEWLRHPLQWSLRLLRWLFCWRMIKRGLLALALLVGLAAIACVEENWRGKRAWEDYKREWEAKGEHFDFASFIPPPVPDDQNFALTPIVASSYSRFLDRTGHRIKPENTNVVNRLKMEIYRKELPANTNIVLGVWQRSKLTNLKAWQDHYRTMFVTNVFDGPLEEVHRFYRFSRDELHIAGKKIEKIYALGTNEFPLAPQPQTPAKDVLLALSKYDSAIEELRRASKLPCSRFPLNYNEPDPPDFLFPHLRPFISCSGLLALRATAELENDQTEQALDDVKLILCIANSIRNEPFFLSQSCRLSIFESAIQPIWEGLAKRTWSDAQLAALEHDLAGFDVLKGYDFMQRGERAQSLKLLESVRAKGMRRSISWMCGDPKFWPTLVFRLVPDGWFYMNELCLARIYQQSLLTETELGQRILSSSAASRSEEALAVEFGKPFTPYLAFEVVPALVYETRLFAFAQASADMAKIACALERYRLANGGYPETLEALAPQFVEKVPRDIINGLPLKYRRTENGLFVLYSVGWDEKDDGGQIELNPSGRVNLWKGDWVWRYPAN